MHIVQFINSTTGNSVKNHICIIDGETETFQSYNSKIAIVDHNKKILTIYSDIFFSATTLKHSCNWLSQIFKISMNKEKVLNFINNGKYEGWNIIFEKN